ncbi:PEP-CTERM -sorting domain protein [Lyngbya aestuarii BL J]|uniref:PEP-CTERM-sorting domain protein n=1 Tax=Lyngbya aestuarii BL J TaxID=1348334 RepID=U7QEM9_9CYAN|nr:PEP-CTERM sorting domain-containing protein [Lyngbya aestuarii]ERT05742.1 PEP-CTERM -sorting domain protein [Lyngbya aestuarii BL J]
MLKTKLLSGFITVTAATISIVGFATEAIASTLYLTPGETSTIKWSYTADSFWDSEHEDALIEFQIVDFYGGSVQFAQDSLMEESGDGTQYAITNDAISDFGIRENGQINYRPLSAQDTPGGETTAGFANWLNGQTINIYTGLQTLELDSLFERVTFFNENYWGDYSITSVEDMDNLYLGNVVTKLFLGEITSSYRMELRLDLSNYNPSATDNSQSVPEPASAIALFALSIAGLTRVKKNS